MRREASTNAKKVLESGGGFDDVDNVQRITERHVQKVTKQRKHDEKEM